MAEEKYSVKAVLSAEDKNFKSTFMDAQSAVGSLTSNIKNGFGMGIGMGIAQKGMGILQNGFSRVAGHLGDAVSRVDTLNQFPKVMDMMGFEGADVAIKKLSDGVDGLPTALDDIASNAQLLALTMGDLDGATDTAIALNNAFLMSGSSSDAASRGLQQYVQMLGAGKVDMQSWRSLMDNGMAPALQKVAESFGYTGEAAKSDLYDALKSGKITFSDFNQRMIDLNNATEIGGKKFEGFASLAREGTKGIATSVKNIKTQITKGLADMIGDLDKKMEESGLSLSGHMDKLKGIVKDTFTKIRESEAFDRLAEGFQRAFSWLEEALPKIIDGAIELFGYLVEAGMDVIGAFADAGKAIGDAADDAGSAGIVMSGFKGIIDAIRDVLIKIAGVIKANRDKVVWFINHIPQLVKLIIGIKVALLAINKVKSFVGVIKGVTDAGRAVFNFGKTVKSKVKGAVDWFKKFGTAASKLKGKVGNVGGAVNSLSGVLRTAGGKFTAFGNTGKSALGTILSALTGPAGIVIGIGAAVGAIAGITIAMRKLYEAQIEEWRKQHGLSDEMKQNLEDIQERHKEYNDEMKNHTAGYETAKIEAEEINNLKDRYNELIDQNGKVIEGKEAQADTILGQLAKALGVEKDEVYKLIDANGKLGESYDQLAKKRLAEAELDVAHDAYTKARAEQTQAEKDFIEVQKERNRILGEVSQLESEIEEKRKIDAQNQDYRMGRELIKLEDRKNALLGDLDEIDKAYDESADHLNGINTTIENYAKMNELYAEGNYEAITKMADALSMNLKSATDASHEQLRRQYEDAKKTYALIEQGVRDGKIDKATQEKYKKVVEYTKEQLDIAEQATKRSMDNVTSIVEDSEPGMKEAAQNDAKAIQGPFSKLSGQLPPSMQTAIQNVRKAIQNGQAPSARDMQTLSSGIQNKLNGLKSPMYQKMWFGVSGALNALGTGVNPAGRKAGAIRDAVNSNIKPADTTPYGRASAQGLIDGMNEKESFVARTAARLAGLVGFNMSSILRINSPSKVTREIGYSVDEGLIQGIQRKQRVVEQQAAEMAKGVATNVNSVNNLIKFPSLDNIQRNMRTMNSMRAMNMEMKSLSLTQQTLQVNTNAVLNVNGRKFSQAIASDMAEVIYDEKKRRRA